MTNFPEPPESPCEGKTSDAAVEFHLLGRIDYDDCFALQRRLVYEAGGRADGKIEVLLCEHPDLITIGRSGSRGHIRLTSEQLRRERLEVRWVSRSGGSVLHTPGQLAVYPIVPLAWHGWTVGDYLRRLQAGVLESFHQLHVRGQTRPGRFGIWGRSGQLATVGVSVQHGITCHGMFINVNPSMAHFGQIDAVSPEQVVAGEKATMGCLLAERRQGVRMTGLRAALVPQLAAAFGCGRYFLYTGHPLLAPLQRSSCEPAARAS